MRYFLVLLALLVGLAGCAPLQQPSVPAATTAPAVETQPPAPTPGSPQLTNEPPPAGVNRIKVWLPPHMDPAGDTPAARLLKSRLDQFSRQHTGLVIEARVKALNGPGGLLDALTTTSAAAPLALPDLIALPRADLETAALKGLLQPLEMPAAAVDDKGWYDYTRELARVQDSLFGLPFAGDTLVLVYRKSKVPEPPADWSAALELTTPFVFPASDPNSLFILAMYQSNGGVLRDQDGRPFLDAEIFSQVLEFLADAEERGVMPYWLAQYQGDGEIWDAFLENRVDLAVTWLSNTLAAAPEDTAYALLPATQGKDFTYASGWVWAMAARDRETRALSLELAQFLTEDTFCARWIELLGFLPVSSGMLAAWPESEARPVLQQAALSAHLLPTTDILTSLGIPVQQAAVSILKKQAEPQAAAQAAAGGLTGP